MTYPLRLPLLLLWHAGAVRSTHLPVDGWTGQPRGEPEPSFFRGGFSGWVGDDDNLPKQVGEAKTCLVAWGGAIAGVVVRRRPASWGRFRTFSIIMVSFNVTHRGFGPCHPGACDCIHRDCIPSHGIAFHPVALPASKVCCSRPCVVVRGVWCRQHARNTPVPAACPVGHFRVVPFGVCELT